jgi:uncharacterized protein (TIGR02145 family)
MKLFSPFFIFTALIIYINPVSGQSVKDIDGNTYPVLTIDKMKWMGENLRVTHYRNGDPILNEKDMKTWMDSREGSWCVYKHDSTISSSHGKLYNWFAVNDPRGLAPKGWHVSSEKEWNSLAQSLGGAEMAGKKLKEKGADHWKTPNKEATNECGFTATPGGLNYSFGSFVSIGNKAYWWTSTEDGDDTAIVFSLSHDSNELFNLFLNKGVGLSVRCVKD